MGHPPPNNAQGGGLNVYEFICKCWQTELDGFTLDPTHHIPGLYTGSAIPDADL